MPSLSSHLTNTTPLAADTAPFFSPGIHLATAPGSSNRTGDEWPMFLGQLNHAGWTVTTPVTSWGPLWMYTTGYWIDSSPAIMGGRVYIGGADGKLYCIDGASGTPAWSYDAGYSNMFYSSPAITDSYVYVGCHDRSLYCLNAITGDKVWNYPTSGFVSSSPAVSNGFVYVGDQDGMFFCIDATTGELAWSYPTMDCIVSSPAVVSGYVYVGSFDKKLYCFNATTGDLSWNYTATDIIWSSPTSWNGKLYTGSSNGVIFALNATTGDFLWAYPTSNYLTSSTAINNGLLYVGSGGKLYCLNATTGELQWTYASGNTVESSPAIAAGRVYFGSMDKKVYCLNATTGALLWSYATGSYIHSSPAIASGLVYVGSYDYKVYCLPMILRPAMPRNFHATRGNNQVTLTWIAPDKVGNILNYKIFRRTPSSGESLVATIGNELTWTDTNVTNGQTYYYTISAVNGEGEGMRSNEVSMTPATRPSEPRNLEAVSGNKRAILTWQAPITDGGSAIINYRIYRGTVAGTGVLVGTVGDELTWTDTGLVNAMTYYYMISAVNDVGESIFSEDVSVTPVGSPSQPLNLVGETGFGYITLRWQAPDNAGGFEITNYNIYRKSGSGDEVLVAMIGNMLTWTDANVTSGETYYYRVSAVNSFGEGMQSAAMEIIPSFNLTITIVAVIVCISIAVLIAIVVHVQNEKARKGRINELNKQLVIRKDERSLHLDRRVLQAPELPPPDMAPVKKSASASKAIKNMASTSAPEQPEKAPEPKARSATKGASAKNKTEFAPKPTDIKTTINRTVLKEYIERMRKAGVKELHYIQIKNDLNIISQNKSSKLYRLLQELVSDDFLVRKGSNYIIVG